MQGPVIVQTLGISSTAERAAINVLKVSSYLMQKTMVEIDDFQEEKYEHKLINIGSKRRYLNEDYV